MLNKLVTNDPVGLELSINGGNSSVLVGCDFVVISLVGAQNGSRASLSVRGLTACYSQVQPNTGACVLSLSHGDFVSINVGSAKDLSGKNKDSHFLSSIIDKSHSSILMGGDSNQFSGWRFTLDYENGQSLQATSSPFEVVQAIVTWRPGDSQIRLRVESVTAFEDGNTEGKVWEEKNLQIGTSFRIKIEGLVS